MSEETIKTERDGAVLVIRLDRPGRKNALNLAMYDRLNALLTEAANDPGVRAVLFSSSTDAFCAGNDLKDFVELFLHVDRHLAAITTEYGVWTYGVLFLIVFCETGKHLVQGHQTSVAMSSTPAASRAGLSRGRGRGARGSSGSVSGG